MRLLAKLRRLPAMTLALLAATANVAADNPPATALAQGKQLYLRCSGCHSPAYNRTGPKHCGLLGREAGSVPGFDYSTVLEKADFFWTQQRLDQFLQAPLDYLPGTRMTMAGIKSARERQALIDYLNSLNADNPACQ